jgi:hypothetical protein
MTESNDNEDGASGTAAAIQERSSNSRERDCHPNFYSQHVTNRNRRNAPRISDMKISTRNINHHSQSCTLRLRTRRLGLLALATDHSPLFFYPEQRANRNCRKALGITYMEFSTRNTLHHSQSSSLTSRARANRVRDLDPSAALPLAKEDYRSAQFTIRID